VSRTLALALTALLAGCGPPGPRASAAAMAGLARASYRVPSLGLTVSYLSAGTPGARRIVFVHGTPGDAESWVDFLLHTPEGFEYVAIDRPGFGRTEPGDALPSLAAQAEALVPLLDRERTILVGHSYGGPVIAELAARHPDRVAGLVILAGALDPGQEKIHPVQHAGEWWGVRSVIPRAWRNANRELLPLKGELERLAPRLERITAAVTIVHGTADTLVPVANVGYMRPRFTHAKSVRTIVLPDQSHFLPWEHRPVIERAIATLAAAT
jgi:pimeloyl-ACP methyl ester carboxylesterase